MELRNSICYISQTETLFTDSIYNNIVLNRDISYDEFLKVNKLTIVDEIVNKNNTGYDFLLEENGFNLSGGERQRIILARALLKKSDLYIIDEGLNQLDVSKERKILKNLFNEYKDKTIIVISHRFNNVDLFNKKYKLENGCLYEC
jgi:ATP-binding cassette subfamily B protein